MEGGVDWIDLVRDRDRVKRSCVTRSWTFGYHKKRRILWLADEISYLAFYVTLSFLSLMNYFNTYLREVLTPAVPVSNNGNTLSAHANRTYGRVTIKFGVRWRWAVSFTPLSLYPWEKRPWFQPNRSLLENMAVMSLFQTRKTSSLSAIELRFYGRPSVT
jgi:hypothetical protein